MRLFINSAVVTRVDRESAIAQGAHPKFWAVGKNVEFFIGKLSY